ncbi:secretory antigen SsaA-like protein [Bacillus phage SP82G]|nr:secretory antigen SsaA-like protein [Bacillus phage SP82G]
MTVTRYKPEAVITFYTETGDLVARNVKDPKSNEDSDFISITTLRDMNTDSPTFTINLTRKKMWHKWITSNDLVKIEMHRPPQIKQTVFVGLVDDVRKNVVLSDDGVQRVITITGRGIAKAFIENDIGVVPEAEYASTTVGWLQSVGVNLAGSSMSQILKATWDIVAKKMVNYRWENHKELFDIIGV